MRLGIWFTALRVRTLPLSLTAWGLGTALAQTYSAAKGSLDKEGLSLALVLLSGGTILLLQLLSNFANDLGDTLHNIDHAQRQGPKRAVQQGLITPAAMQRAIWGLGALAFVMGLGTLYYAFWGAWLWLLLFLALGILALWAAVRYAHGARPYGHVGGGDAAVFIFFGVLGVGGVFFLHTQTLTLALVCVSYAMGACGMAVLHVNNWRDMDSDKQAGKRSWALRLGLRGTVWYYRLLLATAWIALAAYAALETRWWVLAVFPVGLWVGLRIHRRSNLAQLNKHLPYVVGMTLLWGLVLVLDGLT